MLIFVIHLLLASDLPIRTPLGDKTNIIPQTPVKRPARMRPSALKLPSPIPEDKTPERSAIHVGQNIQEEILAYLRKKGIEATICPLDKTAGAMSAQLYRIETQKLTLLAKVASGYKNGQKSALIAQDKFLTEYPELKLDMDAIFDSAETCQSLIAKIIEEKGCVPFLDRIKCILEQPSDNEISYIDFYPYINGTMLFDHFVEKLLAPEEEFKNLEMQIIDCAKKSVIYILNMLKLQIAKDMVDFNTVSHPDLHLQNVMVVKGTNNCVLIDHYPNGTARNPDAFHILGSFEKIVQTCKEFERPYHGPLEKEKAIVQKKDFLAGVFKDAYTNALETALKNTSDETLKDYIRGYMVFITSHMNFYSNATSQQLPLSRNLFGS